MLRSLLIKNAELDNQAVDVLCRNGVVADIQPQRSSSEADQSIDARGGAILPGLHDHHLHLASLAAQLISVNCGPPVATSSDQLGEALTKATGNGWIRGVAYHESVAGDLTATQIDQWVSERPVRIQHRSGRLWYFNTLGAREIGLDAASNGQLYRADELVSQRLGSSEEVAANLQQVSNRLAEYGVTAATDATPTNDDEQASWLRKYCDKQHLTVMGCQALSYGPRKLMLDDYRLPSFDDFCLQISEAHRANRLVAIHCVSKVEVVFALAGLRDTGVYPGDRLEHATELSPDLCDQVAELQLTVVPNPNFIFSRGDQYLQDNPMDVIDSLYPLKSLTRLGVAMKAGTDAPFGDADPWIAIKAAADRITSSNQYIGQNEAISVEDSLALFTNGRKVAVGEPADLVVLKQPWAAARQNLAKENVAATIFQGDIVNDAGSAN